MNEKRRKKLRTAMTFLDSANTIIGGVLEEERDTLDNWPESLQESEKYIVSEDACDTLDEVVEHIVDARAMLYEVSH